MTTEYVGSRKRAAWETGPNIPSLLLLLLLLLLSGLMYARSGSHVGAYCCWT
jgi:hypothetical protein